MSVKIVLIICMLVCTITDIMKKTVDIRVILFFSGLLILCGCAEQSIKYQNIVSGISAGILFISLSFISNGAIGLGDALIISLLTFFNDFENMIYIIFVSALLAFVTAVYLVVFKGKKKSYEMPFIPFICTAYISSLFVVTNVN